MYDNRKQSGVQEDCSSTPCLPKGSVGLLVKFALRVDVGSFHIYMYMIYSNYCIHFSIIICIFVLYIYNIYVYIYMYVQISINILFGGFKMALEGDGRAM